MALTRFRLPASGSAAVSPAMQSYSHTQATRRPLPTSDATALATAAYTPDSADHSVAGDSHHLQFVSDALATGTVYNVGNSIKLCVQGLEPNANCNQTLQAWVGVYSNDGTTLRQTLRAKVTAAEFNTALRSVFLSTTVANAYTTVAGDRLVVEIGCAGTPGGGSGIQGHNCSIRWGSNGAGGDLLENDTQTGTTLNPWFEIENTVNQTFPQSLAATAVGMGGVARTVSYHRTLAATGVAAAIVTPALLFRQALVATAVGMAALSARLILHLTAAATAVGVGAIGLRATYRRTLAAVGSAAAVLSAQYQAGQGGGSPTHRLLRVAVGVGVRLGIL